jgi:hypothetical protein
METMLPHLIKRARAELRYIRGMIAMTAERIREQGTQHRATARSGQATRARWIARDRALLVRELGRLVARRRSAASRLSRLRRG